MDCDLATLRSGNQVGVAHSRRVFEQLEVALATDAGLALPAAVEPPVLAGRAADEVFEVIGVPLGQERHGADSKFGSRGSQIASGPTS